MSDSHDDSDGFAAIARIGDDDSSKLDAALRRIGNHPYRDARDALIERRRALHDELRALESTERRAERVRAQLRTLDGELDAAPDARIEQLASAPACEGRWSEMVGGSFVRRCGRCRRDVFDPAQMSTREIDALLARAEAIPTTQLRRRADGRVVTGECPASPRTTRMLGAAAAAVAAAGALASVTVVGLTLAHPTFAEDRAIAARHDRRASAARIEVRRGGRVIVSSPPRSRALTSSDRSSPAVRVSSEGTWDVDRALARRVLAGEVSLSPTLSIAPRMRGGRVEGLTLLGLGEDDLLSRLGFRVGDTILAINEHPLVSPEEAMTLLEELPYRERFAVLIERRGSPLIQVYRVVDAVGGGDPQ